MGKFFDNYFNMKKIKESKTEYKEQTARVGAMPKDYQFVFKKIQGHMWMFAAGAGYDMLKVQYELIDLFELGVVNGKKVLEITGEDVASFCDELLKNTETYTENWRDKLNVEIMEKLGE